MCQFVEGQQIAADILNQLPKAWDRFYEAYGNRLRIRAAKLLADRPSLGQHIQEGDLVQDFLLAKVLHNPEVMFRTVALGERPLWPRLCSSLVHHGETLIRKLSRGLHIVLLEAPSQLVKPPCRETPMDRSVIIERLTACRDAIVEALPAPRRAGQVAYGCLLLLRLRMDLLPRLAQAYQLEDGSLPAGLSILRLVKLLTPWPPSAEAQPLLPDGKLTLGQTWEQLVVLAQAPAYLLDSKDAERVLGIFSNTWNVYQMRARRQVVAYHGRDIFGELFPTSP